MLTTVHHRKWLALMSVLGSLAAFATPCHAQFTTVALSGGVAPGTGGLTFNTTGTVFQAPMISADGKVGFAGDLALGGSVTSTTNGGLWSTTSGTLSLIVREGDQVVGLPSGAVYNNVTSARGPVFSSSGRFAFTGNLATNAGAGVTSSNNQVVVSEGSGTLALMARWTAPATGLPGFNFLSFNVSPVLSGNGQMAMFYFVTDGVTSNGMWSEGSGSFAPVAFQGNSAADTDGNFAAFAPLSAPVINPSGKVAFAANLSGGSVTTSNDSGLWTDRSGSLALIAREGSTAPGANGATFSSFSGTTGGSGNPVIINASGQTAFSAFLTVGTGSPAVATTNDSTIYAEVNGVPTLVAREGSAAPGTTIFFNGFSSTNAPMISDTGKVAFIGNLKNSATGTSGTAANDSGVWSGLPGSIALVAREGSPAPGTSGTFGQFASNASNSLVLNAQGRVAFVNTMQIGGTVTTTNDTGLWYETTSGVLTLLLREGDQFSVAPGDDRTINAFSLTTTNYIGAGGSDGRGTYFGADGSLVVGLSFTNGTSGIFLLQAAPVPEPGMFLGALIAIGGVAGFRRRFPRSESCRVG